MKEKIKIIHVCPNFYPIRGGIETFVYQLSRQLVSDEFDVTVVSGNKIPGRKTKLPSAESKDGIKIRRFDFKKISRYNTSIAALKFVLSSDADITHIHGIGFFSDAIPIIKAKTGKKVVLSTHGGIFHTKSMFVIKRIYFNTMTRLAAKFSDKIIAVSSQDKRFMQKIANKKKIVLIGNGIDWGRLSKIKRSGNGKTLVYFGRIAKNKRIDRILHVVNGVKRKLPDVKLFLVGKDWGERKKLEGVVVRLGIKENVAFTGEVSDKKLHAILSKSDVFILASEYEGFGISVIEAMAAGLPVVVNNIETMKELIRNGRNGYIVNFKNHNKTARVVLKLLRNKSLREKIGESARYYSKKFDWSIVAANVEKIYETLFH